MTDQEKVALWTDFCNMHKVRALIVGEIDAAIAKKDCLSGVTQANLDHRRGEVDGLRHARAVLMRKPSDLCPIL
jgi:hypothetical protein